MKDFQRLLILILLLINSCYLYIHEQRLNEHKRLLEKQTEVINKLIIHCEYERNKKNNN